VAQDLDPLAVLRLDDPQRRVAVDDVRGVDELPVDRAVGYYAIVLALPMGMLAANGEWLGVGVTALGVAATLLGGSAIRRLVTPVDPVARETVSVR